MADFLPPSVTDLLLLAQTRGLVELHLASTVPRSNAETARQQRLAYRLAKEQRMRMEIRPALLPPSHDVEVHAIAEEFGRPDFWSVAESLEADPRFAVSLGFMMRRDGVPVVTDICIGLPIPIREEIRRDRYRGLGEKSGLSSPGFPELKATLLRKVGFASLKEKAASSRNRISFRDIQRARAQSTPKAAAPAKRGRRSNRLLTSEQLARIAEDHRDQRGRMYPACHEELRKAGYESGQCSQHPCCEGKAGGPRCPYDVSDRRLRDLLRKGRDSLGM